MKLANIVQRGWDALGAGNFDTLVQDYIDDMTFIMPGQDNVLKGCQPFRTALDGLSNILPPGFQITKLRNIEGDGEVVSIVEWKSAKIENSQLAVLFKFAEEKIYEERWFIDTEQWKSAF
ncbi:nuclear transport factor 2 family protein [Pseudomonas borbori]|uniref:nuclear transport factor 2 family protein n=1 Tax=Pseudomonas borbori TaxID=289003 RepID=UPI000B85D2A8|nr:nuclear transport factor 2 family protein [Pseudomonas borbori]